MSISLSEWAVMGSLAIGSGLFGALPYLVLRKMKNMDTVFKETRYHLIVTILACIGGGVLLSTTLCHMLPENRMSLEITPEVQSRFDDHFPLAEILTIMGFLLIYFLEELATSIVHVTGFGHSHGHGGQADSKRRSSVLSIHKAARTSIQYTSESELSHRHSTDEDDSSANSKAQLNFSKDESANHSNATAASQLGSLVALAALSFHAIMEGIAIGIQNSSNLWLMFGAIASHKFLISFCMGMELCAAKAKLPMYIGSIFLFAILSPLGILIGSFVTSEDSGKSFAVCILEGLTTGTLLYVVFFEILSRERQRRETVLASRRIAGFLQFFGILLGVVAMTCLLTLTDHGHNIPAVEDH